jgi:hypothetical protein
LSARRLPSVGGFQQVSKGLRMLECLLAEVLTSARQGAC